jgi:hypothetical protein
LNCRFYSPGAHWDCRETIEEPVREKDRANFCPYFSFVDKTSGAKTGDSSQERARQAFKKLFGDG